MTWMKVHILYNIFTSRHNISNRLRKFDHAETFSGTRVKDQRPRFTNKKDQGLLSIIFQMGITWDVGVIIETVIPHWKDIEQSNVVA
jgi:hypothetical protein